MLIVAPREAHARERRVALVPSSVEKLVALGATVRVEKGLGEHSDIADAAYEEAGASIEDDRAKLLSDGDLVLRIRASEPDEIRQLRQGAIHLSYLDPFNRRDLLEAFAEVGVTALSVEMIPRSTIAQKMDALSSQASLAGYEAVLLAAGTVRKAFPMMTTPAGTIAPARVFVIGAGVAGLQAIATAKRLGARVEAFDTRPVVKEQVESLGARFVEVDLGETGQSKQGYAKALTEEQLQKQREAMARHCAMADVVITTAQVFGRKAPLIVTEEMVKGMKRGSVIVDLAAETGGNVSGSVLGEDVVVDGVTILAPWNIAGHVAADASLMLSSNFTHFVEHFWSADDGTLVLDQEDEIIQGCTMTRGGAIVHPDFKTTDES